MPYSGSTYSLPAGSIVTDGTTADAADHNTPLQDIETALSAVILRNGNAAFSGNQSMGSNKLTTLAAGTLASDAPRLDQVQSGIVAKATSVGGTVDAIVLGFSPAITAWTAGTVVRWTSGGANTITNPTIKFDTSLGTKTIKKADSQALIAGDIGPSGFIHVGEYNGTDVILQNPYYPIVGREIELVSEASVGTGTTYTISSSTITRAYRSFKLILSALSHNSGSGQTIRIEISGDNGSTWTTAVVFTTSMAAANTAVAYIEIERASISTGLRFMRGQSDIGGGITSVHSFQSVTTGYINAIRISPSAGSFDGGTATLLAEI